MDYLYCRVSTSSQDTDPQEAALKEKFPNACAVTEVMSASRQRPLLTELVNNLDQGDRLIVAALDRLGRKVTEVLELIERLESKGVVLISMREGVDYSNPVGRLVTQILLSVAEMERAQISSRTKVGMTHARRRGVRLGPPKGSKNKLGWRKQHDQEFIDRLLRLSKKLTCREVARELGVSASTVSKLQRRYRDTNDNM